MRARTWIFAAVVALVLAINLGLVSLRIAQSGEDTVHERLAQAAGALRAQLELLDARLIPQLAANAPELIEATRPPVDPTLPLVRPDDKALRASAAAILPEPDLLAVVNAQGGMLSRRSQPAKAIDESAPLPAAKAALDNPIPPSFMLFEGATYRIASAKVPSTGAAVIVGAAVDDKLAAQIKSQIDADVTLLQNGAVIASSLSGAERQRVAHWAASPGGPGFGVLQVHLPGVGNALSGRLPRGATRYAVRGAVVPLDGGVQAALTIPASPYLGWLGRYQAFYLAGLVLFILFGFFWGLAARMPKPAPARRESPRPLPKAARPSLLGTDVSEARATPAPEGEVPWGKSDPTPAPEPRAEPVADAELAEAQPIEEPAQSEPEVGSLDPVIAPEPAIAAPEPAAAAPEELHGELHEEPTELEPEELEPVEEPVAAGRSFAGLMDEPENTVPDARPGEAFASSEAAAARSEPIYPGDEPTRVQPVSAALLDKLRERDDETTKVESWDAPAAAAQTWETPPAAAPFEMLGDEPASEAAQLEQAKNELFGAPGANLRDDTVETPRMGEGLGGANSDLETHAEPERAHEGIHELSETQGTGDRHAATAETPPLELDLSAAAPADGLQLASAHEAEGADTFIGERAEPIEPQQGLVDEDANATRESAPMRAGGGQHGLDADARREPELSARPEPADALDADARREPSGQLHGSEDALDAGAHRVASGVAGLGAHHEGAAALDAEAHHEAAEQQDAAAALPHHEAGAHGGAEDALDAGAQRERSGQHEAGEHSGAAAFREAGADEQPAQHTAAAEAAGHQEPAGESGAAASQAGLEGSAGDAALPMEEPGDADEAHWRETFDAYVSLKEQLGESGRISYEKFAARLAKNRDDMIARLGCLGVRFSVYEKEGKASIKAAAIR